uniref:Uncharacterized protein n=1 Tax=Lepeophtheirus salmonis TaxID=72036 RepID=A0A0K2U768_LEPSM
MIQFLPIEELFYGVQLQSYLLNSYLPF